MNRRTRGFVEQFVFTAKLADLPFLAAAVAFYAIFSIVPLLALILVGSATIGGRPAVEAALAYTDQLLVPEVRDLLAEALVAGVGRLSATAIGSIIVLWSATRVVRGIDKAFARVYGSVGEKSLHTRARDGPLTVISIVLAGIVLTALAMAIRVLPLGPLAGVVGSVFGILALAIVLFPLYYQLPEDPVTVREALPGTVFTAIGWTLLGVVFQFYLTLAREIFLYGPLGGLLLFLALIYAGAYLLLAGATVNVAVSDRQVQQGTTQLSGEST